MKSFYNRREAAEETGLSEDTIRRAIRSGDLATMKPVIDQQTVKKDIVSHEALLAWMTGTPIK